jgi:hypothetical protein
MLYALYAARLPAISRGRAWLAVAVGMLVGGSAYLVGYALLARSMGGLTQTWDYFQQTQKALNAFSEQPDFSARVAHVAATIDSVFRNWFHHTLIFGEYDTVPAGRFKVALLLGGPLLLWARLEWRRQAPPLLRIFVALAVSFVTVALLLGTRLSGHHFMVLLPLSYGALVLGLAAMSAPPPAWRRVSTVLVPPLAMLIGFNVGGQVREGVRLHETRGVGLYSDAINRLAADLDAAPRKPFVYFPDWGLQMPVALLTGGRVGLDSLENLPAARQKLCAGTDVAVAFVTGDRDARIAAYQQSLRWDAPVVKPYAQADGKVVFALATFTGRRDGPGCAP